MTDGSNVFHLKGRTSAADTAEKASAPLDSARLDAIRATGVVIDTPQEIDDLPLKEPGYNDTELGVLTDEECALFVTFYRLSEDIEHKNREITGAVLQDMGSRISSGEVQLKDGMIPIEPGQGVPQQAGETFFRLHAQREMIRATLWWSLGERFSSHHFVMGVRKGRRCVKVQQKF